MKHYPFYGNQASLTHTGEAYAHSMLAISVARPYQCKIPDDIYDITAAVGRIRELKGSLGRGVHMPELFPNQLRGLRRRWR